MIYIIIAVVLVLSLILLFIFIKRRKRKKALKKIESLELFRNTIASIPISLELSRVEPIIKNDRMEAQYNKWNDKLNDIRDNKFVKVDDMLIDLDVFLDKKDYESFNSNANYIELELYKIRESSNHLLDEIKEVTKSEEKYRSIVIKLKGKYRLLNNRFKEHELSYGEIADSIELQLSNIEKYFQDFEKVMDNNDYDEVVHIVKAIDSMVTHMEIVIRETPDVVVLINDAIPSRMKEVELNYNDMIEDKYPLEYLKLEDNIEKTKKRIKEIFDRVKILNFENATFDLKEILEFYDSYFIDFERERLSRKLYEQTNQDFSVKLSNINKLTDDVMNEIDNIKNMYDLKDDDLVKLKDTKNTLNLINNTYHELIFKQDEGKTPYSSLCKDIESLSKELNQLDDSFNELLLSLGNLYDDESRAREQLDEINKFLKISKEKIREGNLPVITQEYFTQLEEANDAIKQVNLELSKSPISIGTLNVRVDTARDLVLKLYSTSLDMVKDAQYVEDLIVFGNRYRTKIPSLDLDLTKASRLFFAGKYKESKEEVEKTLDNLSIKYRKEA